MSKAESDINILSWVFQFLFPYTKLFETFEIKTSINYCSDLSIFYSLEHVRLISRWQWAEDHLTIFSSRSIPPRLEAAALAAKIPNFLNPQLHYCFSGLASPLDSKGFHLCIHWAHSQAHSRHLTDNGEISYGGGLRGRVEILLRTAWVQILALPSNKDHLQN